MYNFHWGRQLRRRDRDAEGDEGEWRDVSTSPCSLQPPRGSGKRRKLPIGDLSGARPKPILVHFDLERTHLTTRKSGGIFSDIMCIEND